MKSEKPISHSGTSFVWISSDSEVSLACFVEHKLAHLIDDHPERIDIARLLQRPSCESLRRHPIATAHQDGCAGISCTGGNVGLHAGETEVTKHSLSVVIDEHV